MNKRPSQRIFDSAVHALKQDWSSNPRWSGVVRNYTPEDVARLRGKVRREFSLSDQGSRKFWEAVNRDKLVALGAVTGNQAVQMVQAGLEAIYLSGWQVAADANLSGQTYPDQSLYPVNSGPQLCQRINNALIRADQIYSVDGKGDTERDWMVPILADAEAGFGGPLNVYELTKNYIEAGASGIHLEDQLSSEKKCGHMGGKVLVPTRQHIRSLIAARLAADVCGVPLVIVARTDARGARLITSDADPTDEPFILRDQPRTSEGYYRVKHGHAHAVNRALAYAPYCDMLWMETSTPDMEVARQFAQAVHEKYPGKLLAYNCSPSFNWKMHMSDEQIANFQQELGKMGYKFQFVTLAGFHSLNHGMFDLAKDYSKRGMSAYVELQEREFASEKEGYTATKHQREVGAGYFDHVANIISGGQSETLAVKGSTEEGQFK